MGKNKITEEEEKWKEEARKIFVGPEGGSCLGAFINGYLQACRKRQENEIILELAFKDGKFSGIVVGGDRLLEKGEVVGYIKKKEGEIEKLKEDIDILENALEFKKINLVSIFQSLLEEEKKP